MIVYWKPERLNYISKDVLLVPGYNDIDDKIWDEIKSSLKNHIKSGNIKIVSKEVTKDNKKINVSVEFKDLPVDKQRELISKTNTIEILTKWRNSVTDSEIRVLIIDQIDQIKKLYQNAKKKKEKKDK